MMNRAAGQSDEDAWEVLSVARAAVRDRLAQGLNQNAAFLNRCGASPALDRLQELMRRQGFDKAWTNVQFTEPVMFAEFILSQPEAKAAAIGQRFSNRAERIPQGVDYNAMIAGLAGKEEKLSAAMKELYETGNFRVLAHFPPERTHRETVKMFEDMEETRPDLTSFDDKWEYFKKRYPNLYSALCYCCA